MEHSDYCSWDAGPMNFEIQHHTQNRNPAQWNYRLITRDKHAETVTRRWDRGEGGVPVRHAPVLGVLTRRILKFSGRVTYLCQIVCAHARNARCAFVNVAVGPFNAMGARPAKEHVCYLRLSYQQTCSLVISDSLSLKEHFCSIESELVRFQKTRAFNWTSDHLFRKKMFFPKIRTH